MLPKSAVIVPLYIYPLPRAWDSLYEAISNHPDLSFVVILNPHDGPGIAEPFDSNYSREIPRLNACTNVRTVGYVRTNYCKRGMAEVYQDISTYAGWATDYSSSGLGVQGIFFDETPNLYEASKAKYLNSIDQFVKETIGIQGERLVIHNPGTVPDPGLANPGPDVTAVFEASYAEYRSAAVQKRLQSLLLYKRDRCAYIVHSVPVEEMKQLVLELRQRGEYLFATSLQGDFYVRFGPTWKDFITAMRLE